MTWLPRADVPRPVTIGGVTVLEAASPVVWFTFPGAWHDIGRFHAPDGTLTGFYANILTPVRIEPGRIDRWWTTDLFLDLFLDPRGRTHLLDADELEAAVRAGWVEPGVAATARAEAERLVALAADGRWPPPIVEEWTLERARGAAG